jgi:XTP/dITP diphosphohydrolase
MSLNEIDWDTVDEVEWGVDDEIDWKDVDIKEDILVELRNDPQPSFFIRKFAVVWWRNGFYKAGKIDGTVRVTPTRFLFLDNKGKVRLNVENDMIESFDLHLHEAKFPIYYNEIITKNAYSYQITTGVNEEQSTQNHEDLKGAIFGHTDKPESEVMELKVVTSNDGKIKEFKQTFEKTPVFPTKVSVPYPEVQASSLEEVVDFGLDNLKDKIQPPFIIDDAGVFVDGLEGFPGVYSRYVYDTIGLQGLLRQLEHIEDRQASFKCVLGLLLEDGTTHKFVGECKGRIIHEMRGDGGFGYDPIFIPDGFDRTFAELLPEEKNEISHRGRAMQNLLAFISEKGL